MLQLRKLAQIRRRDESYEKATTGGRPSRIRARMSARDVLEQNLALSTKSQS